MDSGITTILGGGAKPVDLTPEVVRSFQNPDPGLTAPKQLDFDAIKRVFSLDQPLGRQPVWFWMDLFTSILPTSVTGNPFSLSGMIALGIKLTNSREKESSSLTRKGGEYYVDSLYGFTFGNFPIGNITEAPPVLRHYATADGLRGILQQAAVRSGILSYVEKSRGLEKNFYDLRGAFFTTPERAPDSVGVHAERANSYVDVHLPEGAPVVSMFGGNIILAMGSPAQQTWMTEKAPYPPALFPVEFIDLPKSGPALDIIKEIRPDLLPLTDPGYKAMQGAVAAAGLAEISTATAMTADLLGGSKGTAQLITLPEAMQPPAVRVDVLPEVRQLWRDIIDRAKAAERVETRFARSRLL